MPASAAVAELRWWLPVAATTDTAADRPLRVTVLGDALVLWHDGREARAFTDRCPHRGARLSMGRVHAGLLECPYHGWRFAGDGQCRAVPALPGFEPPPGHRATAWALRQAHGLWWVAAADAAAEAPHTPPLLTDLPARRVLCGPYDVATSAPRVVENFLDTAHFGLVHEGWLGDRDHLEVPGYRVVADAHGRPGVPGYRAWQPQASAAVDAGTWVDYRYQLLSPYSALLTKKGEGDAPQEAYALWTCPTTPEACRVWFTIFTSDDTLADDELVAFQDRIFRQDRPVLESQRPRLLPVSGGELHCAADRLSTAYRRWLQEQRITFGVC
jgi:phenylpropionate dioxygenase-like ring-hydroxylating dioxygenase large terminal subunit